VAQDQRGWAEGLELGVDSIDSDHRLQIKSVEALENAIKRGAQPEVVASLLRGLREHTKAHFDAELGLMRESGYPETEAHDREHERLLGQLDTLVRSYSEQRVQTALETIHSLRPWLIDHIDEMDRGLANHLRARAAAGEVPGTPKE